MTTMCFWVVLQGPANQALILVISGKFITNASSELVIRCDGLYTVLKSRNQAIFFRREPFRQETLLYLVGDSPSKSGLTLNFILIIFHKYRRP